MLGNAVSPPLVAAVAGSLLCSLYHGGKCSDQGVLASLELVQRSTPTPLACKPIHNQLPTEFMGRTGSDGLGNDLLVELRLHREKFHESKLD
jgi:hypothetical protein